MLQSSSSEKIGKTSKNCCFWAQLELTSYHLRSRPKWKTFFIRNNKSRSLAFTFRIFLFYQNIRCFGWVMNPFLFCSVFCPWLKKTWKSVQTTNPLWQLYTSGKGRSSLLEKNPSSCFRRIIHFPKDTKFKLLLCISIVFGASRNVSLKDHNNHILKLFTEAFKNLLSIFLNPENLLFKHWALHVVVFILLPQKVSARKQDGR